MTMDEYIRETRHAAESTIGCYMKECNDEKVIVERYNAIVDQIAEAKKGLTGNLSEDLSKPEGLEALQKMSGKPAELLQLLYQQNGLRESRIAKVFSTAVLCGAVLQIAKQGISIVHKQAARGFTGGRQIAGMPLAEVIFEGRNQALHHEEGRFHNPCQTCFMKLERVYDDRFSLALHPHENLSVHIIDVLGWHSYAAYEQDMRSLA